MTSLRCGPFDQLNQLEDKVAQFPQELLSTLLLCKKNTRTWSFAKRKFDVQSCSKALDEPEDSD